MTAHETLLQYLKKVGPELSNEIRRDKRYRSDGSGGTVFRTCATWEEAHEVLKEYESMKAGLKALQNTGFPTFRGSEDGNPSPSAGLTAKQKKLLDNSEKLEKAEKEQRQLDAVNAQNSSGSGGSCKHGDKCRFSHDKIQVESARKAKKEAQRGRNTDVELPSVRSAGAEEKVRTRAKYDPETSDRNHPFVHVFSPEVAGVASGYGGRDRVSLAARSYRGVGRRGCSFLQGRLGPGPEGEACGIREKPGG